MLKEFEADLKVLLAKHRATLHLMVEGDTHGIYDEGLGVSFALPKKPGDRWDSSTDTIRLCHQYHLNASDLR